MPLTTTGELVAEAVARRSAVAAFNVITLEHIEAVIAAAEAVGEPVILQVSENAVKFRAGRLHDMAPGTTHPRPDERLHDRQRTPGRPGETMIAVRALCSAGVALPSASSIIAIDGHARLSPGPVCAGPFFISRTHVAPPFLRSEPSNTMPCVNARASKSMACPP